MRLISFLTLAWVVGLLSSCGCDCHKHADFALEGYQPTSSKQFR